MRHLLRDLVQHMRNPEAASSVIPLAVVIGIFVVASAGSLYFFFRALRAPDEPGAEPRKSWGLTRLLFLNSGPSVQAFFTKWLSVGEGRVRSLLEEIAHLKAIITRLEKDNLTLREHLAQFVTKSEQATLEFRTIEREKLEKERALEAANAHRERLQKKTDELEIQLREVMREVDNMYQQNAKALDAANDRRAKAQKRTEEVEHHLQDFIVELEKLYRSGDELNGFKSMEQKFVTYLPGRQTAGTQPETFKELEQSKSIIAQQSSEIRQLKELLNVCRTQILAFTRKTNPSQRNPA